MWKHAAGRVCQIIRSTGGSNNYHNFEVAVSINYSLIYLWHLQCDMKISVIFLLVTNSELLLILTVTLVVEGNAKLCWSLVEINIYFLPSKFINLLNSIHRSQYKNPWARSLDKQLKTHLITIEYTLNSEWITITFELSKHEIDPRPGHT